MSVREKEKLCKTDIRFKWFLQEEKAHSFMTIDNFMKNCLNASIGNILNEINAYIFEQEQVDLEYIYIDGTKIRTNAINISGYGKRAVLSTVRMCLIK